MGISQEKLAEIADLSLNMVNDIEGCRTWVSDKTIIKLARALNVEAYRLLVPVPEVNGAAFSSADEIVSELQGLLEKILLYKPANTGKP